MNKTEKILAEFDEKFTKVWSGLPLSQESFDKLKLFLTTSIAQALAEDRERMRKDYTKWVLSDNYKRKYTGETPFREWKEKAEAQDMSNWE